MSDLPEGWEWTTLGEVLESIDAGRSTGGPARRATEDEWGIIRVSAMTAGRFNPDENKVVPPGHPIDQSYVIKAGDILLSRANTEAHVGASVLVGAVRSKLLLSDKSLRLRPTGAIENRYLATLLSSPAIREKISARSTGSKESMKNVSQSTLRGIEVALPPLSEQGRIVEVVEACMDQLHLAREAISSAWHRSQSLVKSILVDALCVSDSSKWRWVKVSEAGRVDLGRQRHPDWHYGPNMKPYLRVANVLEGRIDLADVMQMHFSPAEFERFRLDPGDILLNEGQSPEYLGRPAMYTGEPEEMAFTNSLLRFRAGPDVIPEWALLVFRHHMHSGRFMREVRITTNIAHLSAGRFKSVEFPIPPLDEQARIVASVRERLDDAARLAEAVKLAQSRADQLRRSVLAEAFAGRLVPQDPDDEPASELLARMRAERPPTSRRRTARR